jgi:hypothetical protein
MSDSTPPPESRPNASTQAARPQRTTSVADAILAFWRYWETVELELAESFKGPLPERFIDGLTEHVAAIDPLLEWEFGPGKKSRHHLCLSAKGDPEVRVVAERWRRSAPASGAVGNANGAWEFYASRQPSSAAHLTLQIADQDVAFSELRFGVTLDETREVLDLEVFHPCFAEASEELRAQIAFLALDSTFGEDGVERWVGAVDLVTAEPAGALDLEALQQKAEELAALATGERFIVLQGTLSGAPCFVTKNAALKRVDNLVYDLHVAVDLPLNDPTEEGLTTTDEAETLNALEDDLFERLGENAVYVSRVTTRGHRTIHLHAMEGGSLAQSLDAFEKAHGDYDLRITVERDPRWEILNAF